MSDGLIVVDKPAGMTSHDVVARIRRIAGTRKVGHAGTLDPMATGVLVVGVRRATRLLHHLVLTDKSYAATVRLGQATTTDDAEGDVIATTSARDVGDAQINAAIAALTGEIAQIPSSVSAVKVGGQRAYARVRSGEDVQLSARAVVVRRFEIEATRRLGEFVDLRVSVECSSGTYVRALARDLGYALGVGGHLTALRRTRVGPFDLATACTLDELAASEDPVTLPLADAIRMAMPVREIDEAEARALSFGRALPADGHPGVHGALFGGQPVALLREEDGSARPVLVFTPAG